MLYGPPSVKVFTSVYCLRSTALRSVTSTPFTRRQLPSAPHRAPRSPLRRSMLPDPQGIALPFGKKGAGRVLCSKIRAKVGPALSHCSYPLTTGCVAFHTWFVSLVKSRYRAWPSARNQAVCAPARAPRLDTSWPVGAVYCPVRPWAVRPGSTPTVRSSPTLNRRYGTSTRTLDAGG